MDRFTNSILQYIRENNMLLRGDRVAVGLSGGADSVALVTVLAELQALLGIELIAIHVNHGIRGAEAARDEEFCRSYAASRGIPFYLESVDTPGYAADTGMSEEEAGRLLRYRALMERGSSVFGLSGDAVCKSRLPGTGAGTDPFPGRFRIAVAHHADDQAETILLNLMRGSGLKGLSGMQPVRDNIIRPLLMTGKEEILRWLSSRGISYVTDSTNLENIHTRNRLRNVIMPELKKGINSRAAEHIARFGQRVYEADSYIAGEAVIFLDKYSRGPYADSRGRTVLELGQTELKEKAQIFRIYVIIEALKRLGIPMKDWGDRHFKDIDRLIFMGRGAHADLPGRVTAENIYHATLLIVE